MTDPTYTHLLAKANERAQRRFRAALNSRMDSKWGIEATSLYLQAEELVDRLEIGPCPSYCPERAGGDHDHSDPFAPDMTYARLTESENRLMDGNR